jgi:hypothetical protein
MVQSMNQKLITLIIGCTLVFNLNAQIPDIQTKYNPLNRYTDEENNSFREYLSKYIPFNLEVINDPGILLPGLILDSKGDIVNVFCLNSLNSFIDSKVLKLFELSAGHWQPKDENSGSKTNDIIIIPIVYFLAGSDYSIDRDNFKLPVYDEVLINTSLDSDPKHSTTSIKNKYEKLISKEKYDEAYPILIYLLRRNPLSCKYWCDLVKLEYHLGNEEAACLNLKFIQSNFIDIPTIDIESNLNCR